VILLHTARPHEVTSSDDQKIRGSHQRRRPSNARRKNRRNLTTDILTDQMWGKGSTPRQENEVNIGELIILTSVLTSDFKNKKVRQCWCFENLQGQGV
jgi:hypothetical protein